MRMSSKIFRTEKENGQYGRRHEPSLCNIHTQELTFTKSLSEHTRSLPSPPSSSSTPPPTPCSCWPTTNVGAALGLSVPDPVDFRTCVTTVQKTTNENNHLNLLSQVWIKPKQTNRQTDTSLSCLTTGVFVYVQSIVRVRACVCATVFAIGAFSEFDVEQKAGSCLKCRTIETTSCWFSPKGK